MKRVFNSELYAAISRHTALHLRGRQCIGRKIQRTDPAGENVSALIGSPLVARFSRARKTSTAGWGDDGAAEASAYRNERDSVARLW